MTDAIYLTDKEIARKLGVSAEKWESISIALEKEGLPRRDALFDDRRCWPACNEFLIKRASGASVNTTLPVENGGMYNGFKSKARRTNKDCPKERDSGNILAMHKSG